MKGNEQLLTVLNQLLADELTAISEYMVHAELVEEWGYGKLHKALKHQAKDEMHHAEWLVERILFLEGAPVMTKLNAMKFGKDVPAMLGFNQDGEEAAVKAYNHAITVARLASDEGTADLCLKILKMEEGHMDGAERQRTQIAQMGLQNYLARQTKGATK